MRSALGTIAIVGLMAAAPAAAAPPVSRIVGTLSGNWTGTLGYRDYQSGGLFELAVKTTIRNVPDGLTQIRESVFDEGPRKEAVWITTVTLFDRDERQVTSTGFRKGRPVELRRQQVRVGRYESPARWTLVYEEQGEDGDAKSDIRITETRDGDTLREVKEVRPLGDGNAPWTFRNQTSLRRSIK